MDDTTVTGIGRITIATICTPMHLFMIWLFISRTEYRNLMSFKIMISLEIVDVFHLLAHFSAGLMTVLRSKIHKVLERIVGAVLLSSWVGLAGMVFILALHRLVIFSAIRFVLAREKLIFYTLIAATWIIYLILTVIHLIEAGAVDFSTTACSFSYRSTPLNRILSKTESYTIIFCLLLAFICYIAIVFWITAKKSFGANKLKIETREMRILVQAFIIFAYMTTLRLVWMFGSSWYGTSAIIVDVLNIFFNSSVRWHFLSMFKVRKTEKNITVTVLFIGKNEYRSSISFKIMVCIEMVDVLHLLAHVSAGFMTIFGTNISESLERVTGAILLSSWIGLGGMVFVLALNRLCIFNTVRLVTANEKMIFYILMTGAWFVYIGSMTIHLTDAGAIDFNIATCSFGPRETSVNNDVLNVEDWTIITCLLLSFVCYIGILIWIAVKKSLTTKKLKVKASELRILIQAFIIFAYMAALRLIWVYGSSWYEKTFIVDVLNLCNCLIGGKNPFLYLIFNSNVRRHFFELMKLRKPEKNVTVTQRPQLFRHRRLAEKNNRDQLVFMNDKYAIGITLIVIASICLPIHITFIWLFITKKEYRDHIAFKIMTSLGIMECLHLLSHFMTGLMTVLVTNIHVVLERVTGAVILTSWVGMAAMIFVLSLNRLVVLTSTKLKVSSEKPLFYTLSALSWLCYLGVLALHMTDEGAINYRIRESSFSYVHTDFNILYLEVYESYWILIFLVLSFLCYIVIVLWILFNKSFRPKHIKLERREVRILIQAVIIFVYLAALRATWHYGVAWYLQHVEVVDTLNILTYPILYATMNIVGFGRLTISAICLPLHFIMVWLFLTRKEFRKFTAYKIMICLGIVDCINLLCHFIAGIMILSESNINAIIERAAGAILISSWVGMPVFALVLSLNRLTAITRFSPPVVGEQTFYYIIMGVAWIVYIVLTALHLPNEGAIFFSLEYLSFDYVASDFNTTMTICESYIILVLLALSLLCYIGIFLYIVVQKSFGAKHVKIEKREVMILIQAMIIFAYITWLRCTWQFGDALYADRPIVVDILDICNVLMGGINPFLYLAFNGGLREEFFALLGITQFGAKGKTVTVSVVRTMTNQL
ncbi:hypothetical protein QR680_010153 [Steinernema hermaphroditum]|uniref:G-protein coupled receptors family 1 profile domain-containing protein n=1 Tax=Steinernema hermaphroditum TaxID=289476 RepID=A0AA39IPL5_9BILA|nr:hypothetical protein QR680_010153 [Steinernema hermaphroditum]